jgi:hypothetical protein
MLGRIMAKAGLQRCIADEGVFVPTPKTTLPPSGELAIGSWVDDLIGIAPTDEALNKIEASIEEYVELEKRGKPKKSARDGSKLGGGGIYRLHRGGERCELDLIIPE